MKGLWQLPFTILGLLLGIGFLGACSQDAPEATRTPVPTVEWHALASDDTVSIRESTITWETYAYQLANDYSIQSGSYNGRSRTTHTYSTWILENKYLQVTLLPELGGRIISLIYKPTGHEELYRNPVGVPYQIGTGVFYYDWLMVYGGIFPTFPEPEHGKTWLLPWDFEIVSASDDEVAVAMTIKDVIDRPAAPRQYARGATGLEVTFAISLKAGRAALDTSVRISNPSASSVPYEYWTVATLAPGADPADPRTTAAAEIIAPIVTIMIPGYWTAIAAQEDAAGLADVYKFDALRRFENWPDMGIAYAYPDMRGATFWGVINHDAEEGLFRIADNTLTPGMKIWTWGYPQSSRVDPQTTADEARPYIELWGGITREFWQRTTLPAQQNLEIDEIYAPSVGLQNVTHANEYFLVDLAAVDDAEVHCRLFGLQPEQRVDYAIGLDGEEFHRQRVTLSATEAINCSTELPALSAESVLELVVETVQGELLFFGTIELANHP